MAFGGGYRLLFRSCPGCGQGSLRDLEKVENWSARLDGRCCAFVAHINASFAVPLFAQLFLVPSRRFPLLDTTQPSPPIALRPCWLRFRRSLVSGLSPPNTRSIAGRRCALGPVPQAQKRNNPGALPDSVCLPRVVDRVQAGAVAAKPGSQDQQRWTLSAPAWGRCCAGVLDCPWASISTDSLC